MKYLTKERFVLNSSSKEKELEEVLESVRTLYTSIQLTNLVNHVTVDISYGPD